jgi:hypothetical protein
MLDHSCQTQRHSYAERGLDLYETPACAVEALLRVEKLPLRIWEPACGRGAIVNVLRAHGHQVVATDIADYGLPIKPPGYWGRDFLLETKAPEGTELILTNPPFRIAEPFVAHALELYPLVIMLLRLVPRVRTALQDPRRTRIGACLRLSKTPTHDAPRRLARAQGQQRNGLRVVRLGPRPHRAHYRRAGLLGAVTWASSRSARCGRWTSSSPPCPVNVRCRSA